MRGDGRLNRTAVSDVERLMIVSKDFITAG
jgi:hypothetical protein